MKKYTVEIKRENETIFIRQITADEAIEMMRPSTAIPYSSDENMISSEELSVPVAKKMRKQSAPSKGKRGGARHCRSCGEAGHISKTCKAIPKAAEEHDPENASEAIDAMRFPRMSPEKLSKVKDLLKGGETSNSEIADSVGMEAEQIDRIRTQLGL